MILLFFQFATKVKALIDAKTCNTVKNLTICGTDSDSYSYYENFTYKNNRVIIISGVPNHKSEYSQTQPNPNKRCKHYLKKTCRKKQVNHFNCSSFHFLNVCLLNFSGVRYQYVVLPLSPTKSSSGPQATGMGATAFFTSGAVMYNPLSSPQGNLALDKEWVSLDPCYGHSSPDYQYHYHAVSQQFSNYGSQCATLLRFAVL